MNKWFQIKLIIKISFFCLCWLIASSAVHGQVDQNPVGWRIGTKRLDNLTFELHLKATIRQPWHIYSQNMEEGTAVPTSIHFEKNPLVVLEGKCREIGNAEEKLEEGVLLKYYSGEVEFVQIVRLKAPVKTTLSGIITFMVCTHERCLPPAEKDFRILLDARQRKE